MSGTSITNNDSTDFGSRATLFKRNRSTESLRLVIYSKTVVKNPYRYHPVNLSPYPRQTAARVIGLRDAFDEMEDLVSKMDRKSRLTQEPLDKQEKKDIRKKVKMVIKTIAALSSSPSVKLMDLYCSNSFLNDPGRIDNENGLVWTVQIHEKV